jgi:hypothetical protein
LPAGTPVVIAVGDARVMAKGAVETDEAVEISNQPAVRPVVIGIPIASSSQLTCPAR